MKYMLMMNAPGGPYQVSDWSQQDFQAHIAFMKDFNQKLVASGELAGAEGLAGPDQAKRVRADRDGAPITDGVFPEAKEFLAGYWIVDVESPERAYELAARASAAPGPGGKPLNLPPDRSPAGDERSTHGPVTQVRRCPGNARSASLCADDDIWMPVVNSPRMAVCGYTGT